MAITYRMEAEGDLLRDSPEDVYSYMGGIAEQALKSGSKRILCDERELVYAVSMLDTFKLAEEASKYSDKFVKITLVCNKQYLKDGKLYETVASNRGLKILVTDNFDQAMKWIA
jgi:hypothetical protein